MTISCPYISYGCQEKVNYMQKEIHEKSCIHAPCVCPILDCAFCGSSKQLSIHFAGQHQFHRIYNGISSVIMMGVDDPFLVLHADDNHPLFILNNLRGPMGNAVWVTCVRPNCFGVAFRYNIKTKGGGCSLEFWSFTASVRERAELTSPLDTFLLIPHSFSAGEEKLNLNVSILDSGF
ncbi:hypothetical protein QJS10_CPA03g00487 [Acorus calamus]|uniref:SIAH-type domain-containing protein n=1 Tax=Acorus calamus TaxID=4465 RepID=A0AAV9F727_ACOCL|nr:hypothetical protein QJS10_CPA03g00487 [Acorus calamus]